jgi:phosphatidylglycerol:prolipoprotein diacylglycerol transferase
MSFHGGFLGVLIALYFFARSRRKRWLAVTDFVAPLVPLGLAAGRLGNFINGELWGRVTDVPWGMVFPRRGPSRDIRRSSISSVSRAFCSSSCCGSIRSADVRSARPPGSFSWATAFAGSSPSTRASRIISSATCALGSHDGQWLSLPMIVIGAAMLRHAYRRADKAEPTVLDRMK